VAEIPEDSVVVVAFNTPEASRNMCERLKQLRPEIDFVAPPMAPQPASEWRQGARGSIRSAGGGLNRH
jgi:hypothetical protein